MLSSVETRRSQLLLEYGRLVEEEQLRIAKFEEAKRLKDKKVHLGQLCNLPRTAALLHTLAHAHTGTDAAQKTYV